MTNMEPPVRLVTSAPPPQRRPSCSPQGTYEFTNCHDLCLRHLDDGRWVLFFQGHEIPCEIVEEDLPNTVLSILVQNVPQEIRYMLLDPRILDPLEEKHLKAPEITQFMNQSKLALIRSRAVDVILIVKNQEGISRLRD